MREVLLMNLFNLRSKHKRKPKPPITVTMLQRAELQSQLDRVHKLFEEKRRVKSIIKLWIENFEFRHSRQPTSLEKHDLIGRYYEEYNRIGKKYKGKLHSLQRSLDERGLTHKDLKGFYGNDHDDGSDTDK